MFDGVNLLCFTASYGIALALEVTRLMFRSGVRGAVMLGFGAAGLVAHTLYLANRVLASGGGAPLSSAYDWYLVAAWVLAATYLYLTLHHPRAAIGLFVLPLVLGLIGVAFFLADTSSLADSQATYYWGLIHGVFLLLGTVTVAVGFVAGTMYLIQSYRLKHKLQPRRGLELPSLEWLERVNSRAIVYSLLLLSIGVMSGVVLNVATHRRQSQAVPWSDPIVIASLATMLWLTAATLFNVLYRPARQGRKVAYLTVASFVLLAVSLALTLLLPSQHRPRAARAADSASDASSRPTEQPPAAAERRAGG